MYDFQVILCICAVDCHAVQGYFAERQGEREDMQDSHVIINNFTPQFDSLHPSVLSFKFEVIFHNATMLNICPIVLAT